MRTLELFNAPNEVMVPVWILALLVVLFIAITAKALTWYFKYYRMQAELDDLHKRLDTVSLAFKKLLETLKQAADSERDMDDI